MNIAGNIIALIVSLDTFGYLPVLENVNTDVVSDVSGVWYLRV